MNSALYLFAVLGWSVLGFVAGVLVTQAYRKFSRIADAVAPRKDEIMSMPEQPVADVEAERRHRRRANRFRIVVGTILVLIGVFSAVSSFVLEQRTADIITANAKQDDQDREIQRCLTEFGAQFANALEARSGASSEAQALNDEWVAAINDLLVNAVPGQRDPAQARVQLEKLRKSTADYLAKRAEAKKKQRENPFPPSPREC